MSRPRRTWGYARVSGDEQGRTGTSLDAQAKEIEAWCKARGYPKPKIFSEIASGSRERLDDRVKLAQLLNQVEKGDLIVVSKVDRWSRDLVHSVESIRKLVRDGIAFFAIGESCDPSTIHGDQMLGIMAWAADAERQRIKERTVGTRRRLRDEGFWAEGSPPYGFRIEARKLVQIPDQIDVMRKVFAYVISHSVRETVAYAKKLDPGHGWDRANLAKALTKRWWLGETRTTSGTYIKSHQAVIDADLFRRAQDAMASRKRIGPKPRTPKTANWLMRGIAKCAACGAKMSAAYSPKNNFYYVCATRINRLSTTRPKCDSPYVPVPAADALADAAALARLVELRAELSKETGRAPIKGNSDAEVTRLLKQRERLIDMAADGKITAHDMATRVNKIASRLSELEADLAAERRMEAARNPKIRRALLSDISQLQKGWRRSSNPQKRAVIEKLARSVSLSLKGPVFDWRSPEELVL